MSTSAPGSAPGSPGHGGGVGIAVAPDHRRISVQGLSTHEIAAMLRGGVLPTSLAASPTPTPTTTTTTTTTAADAPAALASAPSLLGKTTEEIAAMIQSGAFGAAAQGAARGDNDSRPNSEMVQLPSFAGKTTEEIAAMLQSGALSGGSGGSGGFTTSVVPVPAAPAPVSPPAALVTAAAVLSEVSRLFSKPKLKAHLDPKNIIKLEGMSTDEIASMIQSGSMFGADSAAASAAAADDKVDGNGNGAESSDDGARPVANTATTPHSLHVLEGTRRAPPASSRIPEPPLPPRLLCLILC